METSLPDPERRKTKRTTAEQPRVEELPQPYYNARIVLEPSNIAPVSKNNLMIADVDNKMMDVTYKIGKTKPVRPNSIIFHQLR